MQEISYVTAMMWYGLWPFTIYVAYKFIFINIEHLENNLEQSNKETKQ